MPDNRGLAFDVNETYYLNAAQGISEMLTISLDPDILVQSQSEYVQVRGLMILKGEYKKSKNSQHQQIHNQSNHLERIQDVDDDVAKFFHRIPVEVAIPMYRINDLNDIKAVVESFDYELPNEYSLKINASLHILGMNNSQGEKKDDHSYIIHNNGNKNQDGPQKEIRKMPDDFNQQEKIQDEQTDIAKEPLNDMTEKETHHDVEVEKEKSSPEDNKIEVQLVESERDEESTPEDEKTDVLFLTEFFSEESSVNLTQLKIHITQEDDTIESIASRYDIPTTKLIQDNNLTNQQLEEGKLLAINEINNG